ncbi:MAG: hypothetical protein E7517_04325 [Ruminococcaceae bacterium]|nr:hypothetical protein [Oscillospiraceae bacterium]
MSKSIFTYDKKKNCAYCAFGSSSGADFKCQKGSLKHPCEQFRYDVFKRQPKKSPALQAFDASDFSL